MTTLLKQQAIQTALVGDWTTAITLNKALLKEDPNDIEALNRLAFAFSVTGKAKEAKHAYQKVLALDSQNPIALKNLKRLQADKKHASGSEVILARTVDSMYLEESGKTKVVDLINIADPKTIARLITGECVTLRIKRLKIFVLDAQNRYVGMLPDNIGMRLIRFLKGGNVYDAYIKAVASNRVTIFIRETKRVSRFKNQPSFILDKSHLTVGKSSSSKKRDSKHVELDEDYAEGSEEDESF